MTLVAETQRMFGTMNYRNMELNTLNIFGMKVSNINKKEEQWKVNVYSWVINSRIVYLYIVFILEKEYLITQKYPFPREVTSNLFPYFIFHVKPLITYVYNDLCYYIGDYTVFIFNLTLNPKGSDIPSCWFLSSRLWGEKTGCWEGREPFVRLYRSRRERNPHRVEVNRNPSEGVGHNGHHYDNEWSN